MILSKLFVCLFVCLSVSYFGGQHQYKLPQKGTEEGDYTELLDFSCTLATWHSLEKGTTAPGGPPRTTENTYLVPILWFLLDDLRDEQPPPLPADLH